MTHIGIESRIYVLTSMEIRGVEGVKRLGVGRVERGCRGGIGWSSGFRFLATSVLPFLPFCFGVSLLDLNIRKMGTLIMKWSLGNLENGTLILRTTPNPKP